MRRSLTVGLVLFSCLLVSHQLGLADDAVPSDPPLRWWKGNLHTHSLWSDGNDFPEMIAEWYRVRDYNFLALSDHNTLSDGLRWMKATAVTERGGADVLEKYQARFGGGWVETQGEPGAEDYEVRLKPLDEFRSLVEQRGQFIMIEAEEISDRVGALPVHMNATNLGEVLLPVGGATVQEALSNNLRAVQEQATRRGREILLHLNHPNFGWAFTAEDIAAVVQEQFFEVYNGHPDVHHLGDESRPGVERIWDIANTIRLGDLDAQPLLGIATDDSHNYHSSEGSTPGRGWVMVQARYLTPECLVRAMKRSEFYASSGVSLHEVTYDADRRELLVAIDGRPGEAYETKFIGTRLTANHSASDNSVKRYDVASIGETLATVTGLTAKYQCTGSELFVRAVVTAKTPHSNPSFAEQRQQAWTQPVVPQN